MFWIEILKKHRGKKMKNKFLKTIGTAALAILMMAAFAQISVSAQDMVIEEKSDERTQKDASTQRKTDRLLEGSWNIQVTRRDCQTGAALASFPTMSTFMRGGTMQDYGIAMAPTGRGTGHGVWSYDSGRRYNSAFQFFLFGADGISTGRQIIRRQIELSKFGSSSYTAVGAVQVLNTSGIVVANICTTEIGTRFE
jgi:hypothetical protein